MNDNYYNKKLNGSINKFLKGALKSLLRNPVTLLTVLKTIPKQRKAAIMRAKYEKEGIQVPPYMFISVTNRCNLNCKGCYSKAQHRPADKELNIEKLRSVISEAQKLGISFIFLAGGEPLMKPEILDITKDFPDVIFPLFTNGLLITDEIMAKLKKQKNVIPVISIEGHEAETDMRRGTGVFKHLDATFAKLKNSHIFYGLSFTVTSMNFGTVTDKEYIKGLIKSGAGLFFFIEYVPVNEETTTMAVTDEQRKTLSSTLDTFKAKLPALFVSFPGDEKNFGGCLSAGRGFIHVSAEGALEPCPFAPFSDANLKDMTLKDAMKSELLQKIRENREQLGETSGGCALWNKREWVKSLTDK